MKMPLKGAVDCDLHPAPPGATELLPYLDEYWRDQLVDRHIARYSFNLTSYPPNPPLSARPDWRQPSGAPGGTLDMIRSQALDPFGTRFAICNVLHGAAALFNEDMAMALCSAINDWVAKELLDREPRLRASILCRCTIRSVLSQRSNAWLRTAASSKCCCLRWATCRWPPSLLADLRRRRKARARRRHPRRQHVSPRAFVRLARASGRGLCRAIGRIREDLLGSAEGVFQQFPSLRVVLIKSGFTWLPNLLWRTSKSWRGMRAEVPWIDRSPAEIIRDHVRLTLQPVELRPATVPRCCARWSTSAPIACCCSRRTIRTGISMATTCYRMGCPAKRSSAC